MKIEKGFSKFYGSNGLFNVSAILAIVALLICSVYFFMYGLGFAQSATLDMSVNELCTEGAKSLFRVIILLCVYLSFIKHNRGIQKAFLGGLVCVLGLYDFIWVLTLPGRIDVQPISWTIMNIPYFIVSIAIFVCYFFLVDTPKPRPVVMFIMHISVIIISLLYLNYVGQYFFEKTPSLMYGNIGELFSYVFLVSVCTKLDILKDKRQKI